MSVVAVVALAVVALALCPARVQMVAGLAVMAYVALRPRGSTGAASSPRLPDAMSAVARPPCQRASDRFDDATAAIAAVSAACARFDPFKGAELAAALDACLDEYMKVLTRSGQESADALASHVFLRERVAAVLQEAHVCSDADASPKIDVASARVAALFTACDDVMHADGKADRAAPRAA